MKYKPTDIRHWLYGMYNVNFNKYHLTKDGKIRALKIFLKEIKDLTKRKN